LSSSSAAVHQAERALHAQRDTLLLRDAQRLSATIARARGKLDGERFAAALAEAQARAERRAALAPAQITYPEELPVVRDKQRLIEAIAAHQVIVVCGETGSGKTTQLPKICLEMGRGRRGLIGHTQPRRLAARSVAGRIAQELGVQLGGLVGFETRFDRRVSEHSLIKLMTDGILLAELQRDRELLAYDTIIIDEAHERSLNIDFLLGWLRRLLPRRPELKLIVTSATLDPERLAAHFGDAPILQVEGRTYPVEMRYREATRDEDLEQQVADGIDTLWHGRPAGDVLVFLPGEREIRDLSRSLPGRFPHAEVLPLYSRLPAEQQDRVFGRGRAPRIVLATNVAETSITVPGIRYVVDTGTARVNRYSPRLGVQLLQIEPVSRAAANQRAGRCGRVGPGVCLRLYSEDDFNARPEFTDPEILRANLAGVILQMAGLGLGDIDAFPWVDPPEDRHVSEGYRLLQTLGALDEQRRLTPQGRELGRLPLDPRIARIALAARGGPAEAVVWVLAAALSVQDPHEVPPDQQPQARQQHAQWRHPRSDFLTLANLWQRWQQWSRESSNRQLRRICREHFVSYLRMEEWEAVHRQLLDLQAPRSDGEAGRKEHDPGWTPERLDELYPAIHKALAAGLIDHIGVRQPAEKNERPEFQGPRGRRFRIFPGSILARKPPQWVLSAQLAQTSQLFARTCAEVDPDWLAEVGAHLVKKTVTHPTWNAERGQVMATEYQSLFGLQLTRRNRHYGSIDAAEARRIFILEALVRGDWPAKPRFLAHNLALVADVQEKEARLRRPDLLADEAQLFAFYDSRLPADVCTASGLKSWLRHASKDRGDPGRILQMTEADVLRPGADADVESQFPDVLEIGGHRIALSYQHDPGEDADGVTFHVPIALLYQLPATRFEWLVPGLLPARIEALIRSLPMRQRRHCTPAAEYATALAARMSPDEGALLPAICAHFAEMTGVELQPSDFEPDKLPAHLRPRLLLEDAQGRALAEGESLEALAERHRGSARAALQQAATERDDARAFVRDEVRDWDFGDLPQSISLPAGARAYPALCVDGGKVALRLFETMQAAAAAHGAGVRALLLGKFPDRMRDLAKTARQRLGLALVHAPYTPEDLARAVAERAAGRAWELPSIRGEQAFRDALQHRGEFGRLAATMLGEVCDWLGTVAELRRRIREIEGRWPAAAADLRTQLDTLFAPGFVQRLPDDRWSRVPVWLRAAALRLERLPNKPQRDAEALAQLTRVPLPGPDHPARWLVEEWRIALFAQELRAHGAPTADKIRQAVAAG
jgi:ATP-dependent helicase HrpA